MKSLSILKSTEMRWHLTERKGGGTSDDRDSAAGLWEGLATLSALFRSHCLKLCELRSGLVWVAGGAGVERNLPLGTHY